MRRIGKGGDTSRSEADILAATDSAYKSIRSPGSGDRAGDVSGANVNIGGKRRWAQRKTPWLIAEPDAVPVAGAGINGMNFVGGIIPLALDMWRTEGPEIPARAWENSDAPEFQESIREIM